MTPEETSLKIKAWNDAQREASGAVEAPTRDQVDDLIAKFG